MERLRELAQKTGIKSTIIFLESELIKIPAVIGHVETFFFFNPAITWISSLIREEREACCDDLVIAHISQKTNYLQALVSFQELQPYPNASALALTGNKHYLLTRVKRMLTSENKKLNHMEKTVLILSIVGITAFGFITKTKDNPAPAGVAKSKILKPVTMATNAFVPIITRKKPGPEQKKLTVLSLPKQNIDTVPKTTSQPKGGLSFPSISSNSKSDGKTTESQVEATDNEGRHYSIKRIDGQVTFLAVNGTVIPKDKYDDYADEIAGIDEAKKQRMLKRKQDLMLRQADLMLKQKEMMEKKFLALENHKDLESKNELRKLEYEQKKAEILQNQKLYNQKRAEVLQNQKLYDEKKLEVLKNQKLYEQRKAEMIQTKKMYRQGRINDDVTRIIDDLNDQNLVNDENNLSFSLSDKELVVDGKKQAAEIHNQFKEKYIQNNRDRFIYSKKGNATSITINKE
jgi:bla regulator protein blaR1